MISWKLRYHKATYSYLYLQIMKNTAFQLRRWIVPIALYGYVFALLLFGQRSQIVLLVVEMWIVQSHMYGTIVVEHIEPKNIKEAMADHNWIESIQDELNQFKRLQVWELVPLPEGKNVIALKWIWKNKCDAETIVVRNKS
ncbi:retrovirus-related pol polyprotein from transposon TNT 1-94 [Tanacetum coccineum]